jgi:predicted phosphodiesterase
VIDFDDALQATTPPPDVRRARPERASGYEWDGNAGFIQTGPLTERPRSWDAFIRDSGLDPDEVEVIEPVQVRGWDSPVGSGDVVRMHYYRLTVRRRTLKADLDELVKAAKRRTKTPPAKPLNDAQMAGADKAFLVALGDLQLGKGDGDGVEGTFARFLDTTAQAVARYKRVAKGAPIYLAHLGDCIEGMVSQGGANTWRTTLTTTEQVRLYRRLLIEQVKAFSAVTPRLVVAGVPGNHDEAHRPLHTYGDSWAIDSIAAVRDALDLAGNYEHVTMHVPSRDELTLTLDVCGTIVGLAHGHQWRAGQHTTWWAKQAHGRQPIGDADLLLSGHLHHLRIEATGSDKTFVQVPALESGSQWWKHRTGEWGQPGIVTAVVGGGSWSSLEVLS